MKRQTRHATRIPQMKRWKKVTGLTLIGSFLFASAAAASVYTHVQSQITSVDNSELIGNDRPTQRPIPQPTASPSPQPTSDPIPVLNDPYEAQALNILVMGSDVRDGENADLGGQAEGMRTDTTIIAHVSADRQHIEFISIPRDSWVKIPSCTLPNGKTTKAATTKFNAAFAYGGQTNDVGSAAACTIRTIESLTDIYIDAWVVLDFSGFAQVVDSIGGVEIQVDEYINSPKANGLILQPGLNHLDGATALSYARARSGEGLDGSDISRINRQQQLFEAILTKAQSQYANVPALLQFMSSAASTLTASDNIAGLNTMAGLAYYSKDAQITFTTVPWVERGDGANVVWTSQADELWERILTDTPAEQAS